MLIRLSTPSLEVLGLHFLCLQGLAIRYFAVGMYACDHGVTILWKDLWHGHLLYVTKSLASATADQKALCHGTINTTSGCCHNSHPPPSQVITPLPYPNFFGCTNFLGLAFRLAGSFSFCSFGVVISPPSWCFSGTAKFSSIGWLSFREPIASSLIGISGCQHTQYFGFISGSACLANSA